MYISEASTISLEHFPMAMGFFSKVDNHMSWLVEHKLKSRIRDNGHTVLEVTERSYVPTDAFKVFSKEDKEKIQPLEQVAHTRYVEKRNNLTTGNQANSSVLKNFAYAFMIIIFIIAISTFWG